MSSLDESDLESEVFANDVGLIEQSISVKASSQGDSNRPKAIRLVKNYQQE